MTAIKKSTSNMAYMKLMNQFQISPTNMPNIKT